MNDSGWQGSSLPSRLALFVIANALILAIVSLRYLAVVVTPSSGVTALYVAFAWVGQGFFLVLPLLAFWLLARILPRARIAWVVGALTLATATLLLAGIDTFVYQQYRFHIDGVVFAMLKAGGIMEFLSVTPRQIALFGGVAAAVALIQFAIWRATGLPLLARARRLAGRGIAVLSVCWLAGHLMFAWSSATHDTRVTALHGVLAWQPVLTMNSLLGELGVEADASVETGRMSGGTLHYPLQPVSCTPERKMNVVVILVDAWRVNALNAEVMPNTSAFASRAQRFENHFSSSSSTRGGVFSLFYGLPPTYWLDVFNQGVEPVLVRCLREAGYRFSVHSSATLTNPEFDRTVFINVPGIETSTPGEFAAERDAAITQRFVNFLENDDGAQPFFGFLFYDAAHAYDVPDGEQLRFEPSWEEPNYFAVRGGMDSVPFVNLYRNAMYYIDREVGEVLAALESSGRLDDTIVILTGDHAQEFNDNGLNYWGHNSNFSRAQTHVPLIVHWPGMPPAAIEHMTTHYDIAPTLLARAFNATAPASAHSEGHDLYSPAKRLPLILANYVEYALMDDSGYVVVDRYHDVKRLGSDYRMSADGRPEAGKLRLLMDMRSRFTSDADAVTAP